LFNTGVICPLSLADLTYKSITLPRCGANQALGFARIADCLAGRIDPAAYRGLGDNASVPYHGNQLILAYDACASAEKIKQQIEDLGLDRNETAFAAQLPALDVKRAIFEHVDHHVSWHAS
jgi:hypothetical protein